MNGKDSDKSSSAMTEAKAREILKEFEAYKVFPLTWLTKDEHGNWSAMSIAESKGYLEAREKAKMLEEAHESISKNKCCHCCGEAALVSTKALSKYREAI